MYSNFIIKKRTGTYSDTIEAFGLANLVHEVQERARMSRAKLKIEDKGSFYELTSSSEITLDKINNLEYFPLFRYVVRNDSESFEEDYFDYPKQRKLKKEYQELTQKAYKEYNGKEKKDLLKKELEKIESTIRIEPELDVYTQIVTPNNITGFEKLYQNFYLNKPSFSEIIKAIFDYYSNKKIELNYTKLTSFQKTVTALQIYNPTTGKGLNKSKASGAGAGPVKLDWFGETMKISGALSNMLCQLVKVGSSYDLKVVVPDFSKVNYYAQKQIIQSFKKNVKGNTPLKVDILNLLIINKKIIELTDEYSNFRVRDVLKGLHSTYQKDLGQNKAVINIAELQTPEFISFNTEDEAKDWIEILEEQIRIISSIEELGDATQGLLAYRTFLTTSHFKSWEKFIFWYAAYLMTKLTKNNFGIPFKEKTLNKFFNNIIMDTNNKISEIISNKGLKKVAYAIRKSTVALQYLPKEKREYEVRYGLAQTLQNKSKTAEDLIEFIGNFIATYNAETARKSETKGVNFRKPVREDELNEFYQLLDTNSSKLIGALLASYGFALEEKEADRLNLEEETLEGIEN